MTEGASRVRPGPWMVNGLAVGLMLATFSAITASGKAVLAKLMYLQGADAIVVLGLRLLLAMPAFVFLAWWGGRGRSALTWRHWRLLLLVGFSGYLSSLLDFSGLRFIDVGLSSLIQFLTPTLVLLLGAWRFGNRVSARHVAAMATSYIGIMLVVGDELQSASGGAATLATLIGVALVIASALCGAVYFSYSGELVKALGTVRMVGLTGLVAGAFSIVTLALLRGDAIARIPVGVWYLSFVNASVCTVLPGLAMMAAVQRIGAPLTTQTGLIGPIAALLLGALVLGEVVTAWIGAGAALVLMGIALLARSNGPVSAVSDDAVVRLVSTRGRMP